MQSTAPDNYLGEMSAALHSLLFTALRTAWSFSKMSLVLLYNIRFGGRYFLTRLADARSQFAARRRQKTS